MPTTTLSGVENGRADPLTIEQMRLAANGYSKGMSESREVLFDRLRVLAVKQRRQSYGGVMLYSDGAKDESLADMLGVLWPLNEEQFNAVSNALIAATDVEYKDDNGAWKLAEGRPSNEMDKRFEDKN